MFVFWFILLTAYPEGNVQGEKIPPSNVVVGKDYVYTEQGLQLVVHIWGRVRIPGEYIVPDGTTVLGLISKAGGPDEYANLGRIKLVRKKIDGKRVVKVDLGKYLKSKKPVNIPVLHTGDVVYVPPNNWYTWRKVVSIISQVAIVVSAYYLIKGGK